MSGRISEERWNQMYRERDPLLIKAWDIQPGQSLKDCAYTKAEAGVQAGTEKPMKKRKRAPRFVHRVKAKAKAKAKVTKAAAKVAKTEAAAAWDLSRGGDSTDKAKYDGGVVCVGTLSSEIKCEYCGNMYTGESSCKNGLLCAACVQEYADDAFEV
jgi:hypothetical protein